MTRPRAGNAPYTAVPAISSKLTMNKKKKTQNRTSSSHAAAAAAVDNNKKKSKSGEQHEHVGHLATTRVCIKNLPPTVTVDELKLFLTSAPTTKTTTTRVALVFTDCRILHHQQTTKKSSAATSRRRSGAAAAASPMAFCGFATPDMADYVIRTFHKTYMGTHRLLVEVAVKKDNSAAAAAGATAAHDSNNKRGQGIKETFNVVKASSSSSSSEHQKTIKQQHQLQNNNNNNNNNKPRSKPKIWANDDDDDFDMLHQHSSALLLTNTTRNGSSSLLKDDDDDDDNSDDDSNDDDNYDMPMSKPALEPHQDDEHPTSLKDNSNQQPIIDSSNNVVVSDLDFFLKSKRKQVDDLEDDENDDNNEENDVDNKNVEKDDYKTNAPKTNNKHVDEDDDKDDDDSDSDSDDSHHATDDISRVVVDHDQQELQQQPKTNTENDHAGLPTIETHKQGDESIQEEDPHRLFVRNLPFTATEIDLRKLFQEFGTVTECNVPFVEDGDDDDDDDDEGVKGHETTHRRRNKGFAFLSFTESACATVAKTRLDGSDFQGRLLHILPARKVPSPKHDDNEQDLLLGDPKNLSYKQRQALARRKQEAATTNSKSWSTSFVRGDTVIDSLAEQLGLRKADIVNAKQDGISAGDAAVRLALGETHVIEENRSYFRKFGVDMDALVLANTIAKNEDANSKSNSSGASDKGIVRSKTSILVKNLPFSTTMEELTKVFHGSVSTDEVPKKILLPPSRTIALVEYVNATIAKRAFRRLAYKRFQHVPLYLEWAPLAALSETPINDNSNGSVPKDKDDIPQTSSELHTTGAAQDDEDDIHPGVSHTVYVKNLNFCTTESALRETFSKHGTVRAVKIPQKLAPIQKNKGTADETKTLSMGYGFVELASSDEVRTVIQRLQGALIDGHAIEINPSNKEIAPKQKQSSLSSSSNATKNRTKLMVRNVAFQASRKELLQLFGSFGQLRKVRLPKKFDGTHRGFAFCEYLTHKEAETAMQSLSQTHLYGRHLVLEWASEEEAGSFAEGLIDSNNTPSMNKLRGKAQRDVAPEPKKKKSRLA